MAGQLKESFSKSEKRNLRQDAMTTLATQSRGRGDAGGCPGTLISQLTLHAAILRLAAEVCSHRN